ncbi:oligosaccharide flippase family protein [Vibrio fluvialis]|nr:oligosaccharide flippase family protein [Vibrio fluvialis]
MDRVKIFQFSVGVLGSALTSLITFPIMAWYYPPDIIGKISLLNVVIGFVVTFFSLGLDQSFVREYNEEQNKAKLLNTVILPSSLLIIVSSFLILCINVKSVSYLIFKENSAVISLCIFFIAALSILNRFLVLVFRMEGRGIVFSLVQIIPKVGFLILMLTFVIFDLIELKFIIYSQLLGLLLASSLAIYNYRGSFRNKEIYNFAKVISLIKFGIPLMFGALAYWGLLSIDRVFIVKYGSFSDLALFSVAMSFAGVANVVQSIFSTIWVPIVYKWAHELKDKNQYRDKIELVNDSVCILIVIFTVACGMLSWLAKFIIPNDYHDVVYILPSCMIAALYYVASETTVVGINISKRTFLALICSVVALLLNSIGNYCLIPLYGVEGAVISTSISFMFFLVLRTELAVKAWIPIKRRDMYLVLFLNLLYATSFVVFHYRVFTVVTMLVNIGVCVVVYRFRFIEMARNIIYERNNQNV